MFKRRSSICVLCAGVWLVGCGSGASAPGELEAGQTLTVASAHGATSGQVRVDGSSLAEGTNAFLVDFNPSSTNLVNASALMPAHGHGTEPPTISRTATGYRVSNLILSMPGLWDVTLGVQVGSTADQVEFTVDVP